MCLLRRRNWFAGSSNKNGAPKAPVIESKSMESFRAIVYISMFFLKKEIVSTFFCFVLFFRAAPAAYGGSQARSQIGAARCQPMPQPQQRWIYAASVTYTTAHGNARSLTPWERPGIEPLPSWILVGFVNCWAPKGTLKLCHPKATMVFGRMGTWEGNSGKALPWEEGCSSVLRHHCTITTLCDLHVIQYESQGSVVDAGNFQSFCSCIEACRVKFKFQLYHFF